MKSSVFKPLVNVLYYVSSAAFFINIVITVLFCGVLLFKDSILSKYGGSIDEPFENVQIPVELCFKKEADTTIIFLNKKTKQPQFRYRSEDYLAWFAKSEHNSQRISNKKTLKMYREGLLEVGDTLVSSITSTKPIPFKLNNLVRVKGYIEATPTSPDYWWLKWANGVGILLALCCYIFLLSKFRLLLNNVRKNVFFSEDNFKHLRWIAALLMLTSALKWLHDLWLQFSVYFRGNHYIFNHTGFVHKNSDNVFSIERNLSVNFDFTILDSSFLAGISILILAEIFRYGVSLQHENELTI